MADRCDEPRVSDDQLTVRWCEKDAGHPENWHRAGNVEWRGGVSRVRTVSPAR